MGKNKKVRVSYIKKEKKPRVEHTFSTETTVSWKMSHIDMAGPFGWDQISLDQLHDLVMPTLKAIEGRKWAEILSQKINPHPMKVFDLVSEAQQRITDLNLDEFDTLFEIKVQGRERIWAIKYDNFFRLLWWDPLHHVYPVEKRHT